MKRLMKKYVWVTAMLVIGLSSCSTTYDSHGRPVQSVDPGAAVVGALAVGTVAYAIGHNNSSHHHRHHHYSGDRYHHGGYDGRGDYYGGGYYHGGGGYHHGHYYNGGYNHHYRGGYGGRYNGHHHYNRHGYR